MSKVKYIGKSGVVVFGLVICVLAFHGVLTHQERARQAKSEDYDQKHQVPNTFVRHQFISYSTDDIANIQIFGSNLHCFENAPIVVSSPRNIGAILHSLQNATTTSKVNAPQNGLSGGDTLEIVFKPNGGRQGKPLRVPFNAQRASRWYGCEFEAALNSIPAYQKLVKT